ncbi:MAG: permease-like cell division protein FtsX [Clostridia bacterium]|nr:permease-like cell division protein FtsX [Clostridia bacterium]
MKKISLKYSVAGFFKVFVRSPIMALAALCLLTGTILVFSFTFAATRNIDHISENHGNICILLSDECDEKSNAEIRRILDGLRKKEIIDSIDYMSKSETLEQQKARYPEHSKLFASFTPENSPFKASFTVSVLDDSGYKKIREALSELSFDKLDENGEVLLDEVGEAIKYKAVAEFRDDASTIESIKSAGDKLVGFLGVLIPVMMLVCIILISAVVRIGIFDQREEISLMRAIGATHTYMSAQFIIEGLTLGAVSSIASIIIIGSVYGPIAKKLADSMKFFAPLAFSDIALGVIVISCVSGIVVGLAGSLLASTRYIPKR